MENLYQEILFECHIPRHRSIGGVMRFWHIHQHNCYPGGCETQDGCFAPELQVSEEEYRSFLEQFKKFHKWTKKMRRHWKVSFSGVVDRIHPHFLVSVVGDAPFYKFDGFVLVFNGCMIEKDFFEDPIYVLINRDVLERHNIDKAGNLSGLGRFDIDRRGIITLDDTSDIRMLNLPLPSKEWDTEEINKTILRRVDYLYQDFCMECPHQFFATESGSCGKKRINVFLCTREDCIYKLGESDSPGKDSPTLPPPPRTTIKDNASI